MKQPERYVPTEEVEDDYSDHEDVPDSEVSSEVSYDSDEDTSESEGSLKDFVVESDQEDDDEDGGTSSGDDDSEGNIVQSLHDDA